MIFDILHCALLTAERDVKIMKQRQRREEEDEMMRTPEGINVSRQVALHSADGDRFANSWVKLLQRHITWLLWCVCLLFTNRMLCLFPVLDVK